MDIMAWLHSLPPEIIYAIVFLIVGVESLGVPFPGEVTLMSAALLASQGIADPWVICIAAAAGAIIGDSIGYYIGFTHGHKLLRALSKRYPRYINPQTIKLAESAFSRHGVKTVFFGRFIATLRILAGPLAGVLKMPYRQFLLANTSGGIVWAGVTVWVVYFFGVVAEKWLHNLSWVALGVIVIFGIIFSLFFRKRFEAYLEKIIIEPGE